MTAFPRPSTKISSELFALALLVAPRYFCLEEIMGGERKGTSSGAHPERMWRKGGLFTMLDSTVTSWQPWDCIAIF